MDRDARPYDELCYLAGLARTSADVEPLAQALTPALGSLPVRAFGVNDGLFVDLAAAVDQVHACLTGRRTLVVGHSMGGFVAEVLARRYPETLAGLVLLDASIPQLLADGLPRPLRDACHDVLRGHGWIGASLAGNLKYREFSRLTFAARLRWPLVVPTLVLTADSARGTRWGRTQQAMATHIGADHEVIVGGSHLLATRNTAQVADAIARWAS